MNWGINLTYDEKEAKASFSSLEIENGEKVKKNTWTL